MVESILMTTKVHAVSLPMVAKCTSHNALQVSPIHAMHKLLSLIEAMLHGVKQYPFRLQPTVFQALLTPRFRQMENGFISHLICQEAREAWTFGVFVSPLLVLAE